MNNTLVVIILISIVTFASLCTLMAIRPKLDVPNQSIDQMYIDYILMYPRSVEVHGKNTGLSAIVLTEMWINGTEQQLPLFYDEIVMPQTVWWFCSSTEVVPKINETYSFVFVSTSGKKFSFNVFHEYDNGIPRGDVEAVP